MTHLSEQAQNLLQLIPESGSIGNVTVRRAVAEKYPIGFDFAAAKSELLAAHVISVGRGKGGSVRRNTLGDVADYVNLSNAPVASPESGQTETAAVATEEF